MKLELQKYLESSSIHGLVYISKKFHIIERIFWFITLTAAITCTLVLIIELWIKMKSFPIVSYLSDTSIPVSEINFPAITLCPEFLPNLPPKKSKNSRNNKFYRFEKHIGEKHFYEDEEFLVETVDERRLNMTYREILSQIEAGGVRIEDLGDKILKRLQVVDTMLNLGVFAGTNLTFPESDFLDILNEFEKDFFRDQPRMCCQFRNEVHQYISEIINAHGLCLSFNIAMPQQLLNIDQTSNYFDYKLFETCDTSNSKKMIVQIPEIPRNETSYANGMSLSLYVDLVNKTSTRNIAGHFLYIHDPFELPSSRSNFIFLNAFRAGSLVISPKINTIDNSIVDYKPKDRNCYLETERTLKFFKKYTKANCIQECLTDFMINRCGCVEFFMIRNSTTRICSANEKNCTENAKNDFESQQSFCGCLQPCNYVRYEHTYTENSIVLNKNQNTFYKTIMVNIKYNQMRYNPLIRKQQFDMLDFSSYFGGLLGLFAGISVLSIIELIYWFLIRLLSCQCVCFVAQIKLIIFVFNQAEKKFKKIKNYLNKYFIKSSIHGLMFVADGNFTQRLAWIIIMTLSSTVCFLMISKTKLKIPESRIVAYDDSFKSFEHIDFPCLTIIPPIIRNFSEHKRLQQMEDLFRKYYERGLTVSEKDLKDYAVANMATCLTDTTIRFGSKNVYNVQKYNLYALTKLSRREWFQQQQFSINGIYQPVFAAIPTYRGMAYSFNMLDYEEFYNIESNISESQYFKNITTNSSENNYKQPIKNLKIGKNSKSVLSLRIKKQPNVTECAVHQFLIHTNSEIPRLNLRRKYIMITFGVSMDIEVVPEITRADENLRKLCPVERECYFEGERQLKLFKKYSEQNCIMECFSDFEIRKCGCVNSEFEPAKRSDYCKMNLKSQNSSNCYKEAQEEFLFNDIPSSCSCLPTCDSVTYHIKYFHKFSTQSDEFSINLRVNTEDAILFRRYQQFTFSDVVSYVGGLLGLFAGISMLSIVEIFYFFVIRVAVDIWRLMRNRYCV